MGPSLLLIMLVAIVPLGSCLGCLFMLKPIVKASKNYRAVILKLKERGKYEEWTHQHKDLVLLEKVSQYLSTSVVLSVILLILIGFLIEFASMPEIIVTILKVVGFTFWPLAFIFLLRISKLYKKIPELQSQPSWH